MPKSKKESISKIKNEDLKLLINATFRYSLGRRTYMPSFTVDMIKEHSKIFNVWDWERFVKEIDDYRRMYGDLGSDCDEQTWNELRLFAEKKIKKLTKKGKE